MNARPTMSFRPFGKRHAIQEVVFVLGFSRQISVAEMDRFFSAHDSWRAELPKAERQSVVQIFVGDAPNGAPLPPQPPVNPAMFQSFRRDGTLEWQLHANDTWLAVNCLAYSRWDSVFKQAKSLLQKGFFSFEGDNLNITSVALQYIDTFVWDGPLADYDASLLLNSTSDFFPARFKPEGPNWHFHVGQWEGVSELSDLRILSRIHIDAIVQGEMSHTRVDTILRQEMTPSLDAIDVEKETDRFNSLHVRNKEILTSVIGLEMQEKISLNSGVVS